MKIHYYDLGVYNGGEIDMFLDIANELGFDYEVNGFEAYPSYATELHKKYRDNERIHIHSLMISDTFGKIPLYISTAKEGHSKYSSKRNCTKDFVMVNSMRFSDFVKHHEFKNQFNIIRFNIEGAEWDFINNMIDTELYKYVKIWLGAKEGEDILKCSEIKNLYPAYIDLLRSHNINIYRFIYWGKEKNVDLKELIKNIT